MVNGEVEFSEFFGSIKDRLSQGRVRIAPNSTTTHSRPDKVGGGGIPKGPEIKEGSPAERNRQRTLIIGPSHPIPEIVPVDTSGNTTVIKGPWKPCR